MKSLNILKQKAGSLIYLHDAGPVHGRQRMLTVGYGRLRSVTVGYGRLRSFSWFNALFTHDFCSPYGRLRSFTVAYGRLRSLTAGYGWILFNMVICIISNFKQVSLRIVLRHNTCVARSEYFFVEKPIVGKNSKEICFSSLTLANPVSNIRSMNINIERKECYFRVQ